MQKSSANSFSPSVDSEAIVQITNLETIYEDPNFIFEGRSPSEASTVSFTGTYTSSSDAITDSESELNDDEKTALDYLKSAECIQIKGTSPYIDNCLLEKIKEKKRSSPVFRNFKFLWLTQDSDFDLKIMYPSREPHSFVQRVQTNWEWRLYNSMTTVYVNLKAPLACLRTKLSKDAIGKNLLYARKCISGLKNHSPAYEPEDFLCTLLRVGRQPASKVKRHRTFWNFGKLPFETSSISELISCYQIIMCGELQRSLASRSMIMPNYLSIQQKRNSKSIALVQTGNVAGARTFIKKSCPTTMRGQLWSMVLEVGNTMQYRENFDNLKQLVTDVDLFVDKLSYLDVQKMLTGDSPYIQHVETITLIMLIFSRDTEVRTVFDKCVAKPTHACQGYTAGSMNNFVVYPPSGIIPFYGFCTFIAPMCSMYKKDLRQLYYLFRAVYMRHFFRLHEVSSHPQGILCLCVLFERLLKTLEPKLWKHFRQINDNPLRPVYKWLLQAFSGYLSANELMTLWDVIIAYDSLEVLPVLAVSIMIERKSKLLQAQNEKGVSQILASISKVKCAASLERTLTQMSESLWHKANEPLEVPHNTNPEEQYEEASGSTS